MRYCGYAGETFGVNMEGRRRLGDAVDRGDGAEIVAMVTPDAIRELPQIAGQAVLVALAQRIPGAEAAARAVITRLAERDWDGDEHLRAQLDQALGIVTGPPLLSIPVDLDQLVDLLRGGEHHCGGRLNVRTGEALPDLMFSELADHVMTTRRWSTSRWWGSGCMSTR